MKQKSVKLFELFLRNYFRIYRTETKSGVSQVPTPTIGRLLTHTHTHTPSTSTQSKTAHHYLCFYVIVFTHHFND